MLRRAPPSPRQQKKSGWRWKRSTGNWWRCPPLSVFNCRVSPAGYRARRGISLPWRRPRTVCSPRSQRPTAIFLPSRRRSAAYPPAWRIWRERSPISSKAPIRFLCPLPADWAVRHPSFWMSMGTSRRRTWIWATSGSPSPMTTAPLPSAAGR